jgi:CDP-paratose 2-epimerase
VDQGVFTMWLARHLWGGSLAYFGFGGLGLQVRDLLHPSDLFELICKQIEGSVALEGDVFNVGGGLTGSVSMLEMTQLCREISGRQVPVGSHPDTASVDIPWFVTDSRKAHSHWNWQPQHNPKSILVEIRDWLQSRESELRPLFSD